MSGAFWRAFEVIQERGLTSWMNFLQYGQTGFWGVLLALYQHHINLTVCRVSDICVFIVWPRARLDQSEPSICNRICNRHARLSYCYASVSIISLYLTSINRLFTNTYKHGFGTHNPLVEGPIPSGPIFFVLRVASFALRA